MRRAHGAHRVGGRMRRRDRRAPVAECSGSGVLGEHVDPSGGQLVVVVSLCASCLANTARSRTLGGREHGVEVTDGRSDPLYRSGHRSYPPVWDCAVLRYTNLVRSGLRRARF